MPGELWRGTVQVAKEAVAGVAQSPATRKMYYTNPHLAYEQDTNIHDFATGTRDQTRSAGPGESRTAGQFVQPLSADVIVELLLCSIRGGVTPTTPGGATNARLWTFTPGTSLDTMTVEWADGANLWQGVGVRVNQLTIAGNVRQAATVTADLFGIDLVTLAALTAALPDRTPSVIEGWMVRAYIDPFGTAPGTTVIPGSVINYNVKINNQLGREYFADNRRSAGGITIGALQITGATFLMRAAASVPLAEIANWLAGTYRVVRLEFGQQDVLDAGTNTVQTITTTGVPTGGTFTLTVTLSGVSQTTTPIPYNATAQQVQNALQALPNVGPSGVTCTGGPLPTGVVATFTGPMGGVVVPLMTHTDSLTGGSTPAVNIVNTTPGTAGFKKFVTLDIPGIWTAVNRGQNAEGARAYEFTYRYVTDPALAAGVQIRAQNARTTAF